MGSKSTEGVIPVVDYKSELFSLLSRLHGTRVKIPEQGRDLPRWVIVDRWAGTVDVVSTGTLNRIRLNRVLETVSVLKYTTTHNSANVGILMDEYSVIIEISYPNIQYTADFMDKTLHLSTLYPHGRPNVLMVALRHTCKLLREQE